MSSEVRANKWSPSTGVAGTLGDSGDTFTVPSGATLAVASGATIANSGTATGFGSDNTPAFMAYQGSDVSGRTDGTEYKVPMDTEVFDTDSAFDHTTNYRFTVPAGEGGKYSIFASSYMGMGAVWDYGGVKIFVNGSELIGPNNNFDGNVETFTPWITTILDLSAADYVEVYSMVNTSDGSTWNQYAGTRASVFGGYKLIV